MASKSFINKMRLSNPLDIEINFTVDVVSYMDFMHDADLAFQTPINDSEYEPEPMTEAEYLGY